MFDVRTMSRLFSACVVPVLDYAVGLWRPGKYRGREWEGVEQFWRASARSILGVPVRTPVAAVLGDLGWHNYATRAAWFAACFWTRVTRMHDHELTRQAMHVQRRLMQLGKPCWLREFSSTLQETPNGRAWLAMWLAEPNFRLACADVADGGGGRNVVTKWEDTFKTDYETIAAAEWRDRVQADTGRGGGGNKLRTYALFKSEVELEPYLWRIKNAAQRRLIATVRMGVAPLRIESGRYEPNPDGGKGLPAEARKCQVCTSGCVEDEAHFVVECPAYTSERRRLWVACDRCPTIVAARAQAATPKQLFACMMREEKVVCAVGKFLSKAFRKRELILTSKLVGSASLSAGRRPRRVDVA